MNAPSPGLSSGEPLAFSVTVDGEAMDSDRLVSIETWSAANRIPRAKLIFFDGEPDTGKFPLSDAGTFVPGAKVSIAAGYGSDSKAIHSGIVVRHSIRIQPGASAQLVVETADPLLKMTLSRTSTLAAKSGDSDLITKLVSAAGGTVGKNEAGSTELETMIQYHATDWDMMLLRAEANGCVVIVEGNEANIISPAGGGSPVLSLAYGDSIISLEATADAAAEYDDGAVQSQAWSYSNQQVTKETASSKDVAGPGNLTSAKLAGVFNVSPLMQQSAAWLTDDQLTDWATARLMRAKLARIQGSARFQGNAAAKPGAIVTLDGVGDRFNGDAFVGSARHLIRDGSWWTTIELGMDPDSFASRNPDVAAPPAGGLVPPIRGLHIGQVKQVAQDPNSDFRVLVTLPMVEGDDGVWARLGQYYASSGFGAVFYPEVGDEVVLGFMEEDPTAPVILASVYSSKRAPAYPPNDANDVKALVTRKKMEIWFDDNDVILHIKTPGNRVIKLDDKNGEIRVSDDAGNYISMTDDKVAIFSAKEMDLTSTTNMNIKCGATLKIDATAELDLHSPMIKANADTEFSIASSAMGEIKTGAVLTVNGALVKIN